VINREKREVSLKNILVIIERLKRKEIKGKASDTKKA
jgi:hypothetical protein